LTGLLFFIKLVVMVFSFTEDIVDKAAVCQEAGVEAV
jgi:hypothetical protein